jgi:formylglycine-generating enzyme required for sulfatase activity
MLLCNACKNKDINPESFEISYEKVDVEANKVTIKGTYSFLGEVVSMTINIGLEENLGDAENHEVLMEGTSFSVTVEGLIPDTTYYYRYVVDFGTHDVLLMETQSFTTLAAEAEEPMVKALEWLKIDSTTFRIKCKVESDGGSEIIERGICWNTIGDPILYDDSTRWYEGDAGIFEEYSIRMEHLTLGKKYYVRAYAKNAAGKAGKSADVLSFETEAPTGMPVEIELSCNPEEGGTLSGGGTYEVGTSCTVTAVANSGYNFVNWTENGNQVSASASYTFPVTVARSLVANFTTQDNTLISASVDPENSGTVTGAGGYSYSQECTLTATANTGYTFLRWTENGNLVSTEANYTFNVTGNRTFVAKFQANTYTISVSANPSGSGTVSGGGNGFNYNQSCTVHATPAEGFAFSNWTDEGEVVSTEADYTFTVTSNRTLVANFTELQPDEYSITVSANPSNGGTVSGGGTYQQGQSCTVHATANEGYTFINWTENEVVVSTESEYTFLVTSDRTLVANFQQQTGDQTFTVNGVSFTMKRVEGGTFYMGAQSTNSNGLNYDPDAYSIESPVHSVTLSTFYMGETEVTQALWQAVVGSNPSYFVGTTRPVETVSWSTIVNQFIPALNALTGHTFRLPTEAEWEYAARGGNQGHGYKYAGSNTIGDVAWYNGNSNIQTHPVATKSPNELGLYDMSGNVWEWCSDWYGSYGSGSQTNPQGPSSGSYRVLRGGSWDGIARFCRVSNRSYGIPGSEYYGDGFRLVLSQ